MNCSICITVLNEEKTISTLLDSLTSQSAKPGEIIIVDGGSEDNTIRIIEHYQKRYNYIKLLKEKCSRAKGRNLGIEISKNDIIALTDAGCKPHKDWLKYLVEPFTYKNVDVVAGFYKMTFKNLLGKVESFFLGMLPNKFSNTFLPSTRSIAFRKEIWERVGGFDENLKDAAEDTLFNYKLINNNAKFARVKKAVVEWGMPETVLEYFKKVFNYAKSDVQTKIWIFPGKGIMSHNIKSFLVLIRYVIFMGLLLFSIIGLISPMYFGSLLFLYIFYIYRKIYIAFGELDTALLGIFVQLITDFAVISGFLCGLIC